MKKIYSLIFILCFVFSILPGGAVAYAEDLKLNAKGAVLIDAESGQVLFEQNANEPWYPASITKIMTLALALEAVEKGKVSLSDVIRPSENACSLGGSQVWLDPRDEFTLSEMLIAIAVGSANDASVAVAEFIAGTEENFVKMMNAKAKDIGASNTVFVNSHGLHDDNHYTSPSDMARIARYALSFPRLLELTSIKHYTFREKPKEFILNNTNKLLWRYPGADGIKTGTTSQALRNLVSTVEKDNLRLIAAVMGVDQTGGHFSESVKLYNWGFARFRYEQFFSKDRIVTSTKVSKGRVQEIPLVASKRIGTIVNKDNETKKIEPVIKVPSHVPAPIKKGDPIGVVEVISDGRLINTVDLLAGDSIAKATLFNMIDRTFRNLFCY